MFSFQANFAVQDDKILRREKAQVQELHNTIRAFITKIESLIHFENFRYARPTTVEKCILAIFPKRVFLLEGNKLIAELKNSQENLKLSMNNCTGQLEKRSKELLAAQFGQLRSHIEDLKNTARISISTEMTEEVKKNIKTILEDTDIMCQTFVGDHDLYEIQLQYEPPKYIK